METQSRPKKHKMTDSLGKKVPRRYPDRICVVLVLGGRKNVTMIVAWFPNKNSHILLGNSLPIPAQFRIFPHPCSKQGSKLLRTHEATYNNSSDFYSGYWNISSPPINGSTGQQSHPCGVLSNFCITGTHYDSHFGQCVRQLPSRSVIAERFFWLEARVARYIGLCESPLELVKID